LVRLLHPISNVQNRPEVLNPNPDKPKVKSVSINFLLVLNLYENSGTRFNPGPDEKPNRNPVSVEML
jgi:hypothetical protein